MKAYWGEEILLHMLISDLERGEPPARGQLLYSRERNIHHPSNRRLVQPQGQKLNKTTVLCLCTAVYNVRFG
jgi:hypothetical protein